MPPFEFIDELPEVEPFIVPDEFDEFDEPLPIVLLEPLPIVPEPVVLPEPMFVLVPEPVPRLLPEPLVDGVVPLLLVDDEGLVVPDVLPDGVVVVVLGMPMVPVLVEEPGVVVVVLLDGVVVVVLLDGVVVVVAPGVVVVLEPLLDCASAAPPISNDAAATAVAVLKNEPMVKLLCVERKAHRSAVVQSSAMSDATWVQQQVCPACLFDPRRWSPIVWDGVACRLL